MKARYFDSLLVSLPQRYGLLALIWSVLVGGSLVWNLHLKSWHTLNTATVAARSNINKDMSFRKWATAHGGVYVHPDAHTPPNPYLDVPERDVLTTKGMALTLMNPAYMLRQMQEDFPGEYGTRSHITSLKPLNPKNAPDAWEKKVLHSFEQGSKEVTEVQQIDGQPYLRIMLPFVVEQGCMKCHEQEGYKVGDIRGGIGSAVSLLPYQARDRVFSTSLMLSHGIAWLIGLAALGFAYRRDSRLSVERQQAQQKLQHQLDELLRFQKLTVGRELRMKELAEENAALRNQMVSDKYDSPKP